MHIGISVKNSELHANAEHLVIQVDDNLFDELEEIFTIHNAEEASDTHTRGARAREYEMEIEEKKDGNSNKIKKKYIIHFICDLRCNALRLLADALQTYSSYFIQIHISLSSQIDINNGSNSNQLLLNVVTNQNTNPQQISMHIANLKSTILQNILALNSFHLYINIISNIYNCVYCQLLQIMNDKLFHKFMQFNPKKQSLAFILALSEQSIKNLNENTKQNYWNNICNFLSNSFYLNDIELVVKTQSSLYTQMDHHGFIFNELLKYLSCNKNTKSINSLKLTCWGFLNKCNHKIQKIFGEYLKSIIINNNVKRLWLRYAGINEFILNYVFDAVEKNKCLTDLRIQRMLFNNNGKCLSKLGNIICNHVGIQSLDIGWNMAHIPDIKYYLHLLDAIANNRCNLKAIEIYGDNKYKLKVLQILLTKNTILENIKLNLIDWNGDNDMNSDNNMMAICDKMSDIMIENEIYLQLQIDAMRKYLNVICQFPNVLILNVLDYIYPNNNDIHLLYRLSVEVVINYENDQTYTLIMESFDDKKTKLNKHIRGLQFKVSKPWPG